MIREEQTSLVTQSILQLIGAILVCRTRGTLTGQKLVNIIRATELSPCCQNAVGGFWVLLRSLHSDRRRLQASRMLFGMWYFHNPMIVLFSPEPITLVTLAFLTRTFLLYAEIQLFQSSILDPNHYSYYSSGSRYFRSLN